MPKKKKPTPRGVIKMQNLKENKENENLEVDIGVGAGVDEEKMTASERKLFSSPAAKRVLDDTPPADKPSGFVLVDSSVLCEFLDKHLCCDKCFGSVQTFMDFEGAQGFAVKMYSKCSHCSNSNSEPTELFTSSRCETRILYYDEV